jgi:hypothetical protein
MKKRFLLIAVFVALLVWLALPREAEKSVPDIGAKPRIRLADYAGVSLNYPVYTDQEVQERIQRVQRGEYAPSSNELCGMWLSAKSKNNDIRFRLQKKSDPALIPFYAKLLLGGQEHHTFAIEGLVAIPDERVIALLLDYLTDRKLLDHDKERVGSNLLRTYRGPGDAFQEIQGHLRSEELSADAIERLLFNMGPFCMELNAKVDEPTIAKFVQNPDPRIKSLAVRNLALSGHMSYLRELVQFLDNKEVSPNGFVLDRVWEVKSRIHNWSRSHKEPGFTYAKALEFIASKTGSQ